MVVSNCAFNWVILSLQIWSEILHLEKFTDKVGNEALGYGSYLRSLSLNFFVLFLDGVSQGLCVFFFFFNEVHLNLGGVSLTYLCVKLSQNIILFLDSFFKTIQNFYKHLLIICRLYDHIIWIGSWSWSNKTIVEGVFKLSPLPL